MIRLGDSSKMSMKLSELLTQYDYRDDLQIAYRKNRDGTFTFYAAHFWNCSSSYDNSADGEDNYLDEGVILKFTGKLDVMNVESLFGMAGLTDYVRNNFRAMDLGRFVNRKGAYQVMLTDLCCDICEEFVKLTMDEMDTVYVRDGNVDLETVSNEEFDSVYYAAFA